MKEMKKEVSESAAKMIEVAENLVKVNPSLEKVVLVDCIPRFNHESSHRCGLKSKLARYSNDVQRQIASESEFNDKMIIGNHTMNCNPETYGDKNLPYFDGIHMNGRKGTETYTKSLANILSRVIQVNNIPNIPPKDNPKARKRSNTVKLASRTSKSYPDDSSFQQRHRRMFLVL